MDTNLSSLANEWLSYTKSLIKYGIDGLETQSKFLAFDKMVELTREKPQDALEVILEILKMTDDERLLANLAAGPLEDVLVISGKEIIDRIIDLAKADYKFYELLQGVWGNSIDKEVWNSIQQLYKVE